MPARNGTDVVEGAPPTAWFSSAAAGGYDGSLAAVPATSAPCETAAMTASIKPLTDFLLGLGIERVPHTQKNYLAHLISVYNFMRSYGTEEELCLAGLFHSIYGTERFQGFKLPLDRRDELAAMIGPRAERLAYWNCFMDRSSLDRLLEQPDGPYPLRNRETGETMTLSREEFDDLCRVHLFDWLEQVPRSSFGWGYRRAAYQQMAERLDDQARQAYRDVFAQEPAAIPASPGDS